MAMSNNTTETMTEQQRYQENIEKSANKKVEGITKKKKERLKTIAHGRHRELPEEKN